MPHTRSAAKRLRQSLKHQLRNRAAKSALKTQVKKFLAAVSAKDPEAAKAQFQLTAKLLDKTVSRGIVHKTVAGRTKSHLALKLNKLLAGSPASASRQRAGL